MPRRKRQPTAINYNITPGTQWWAYLRHSPGPGQDIASQKREVTRFATQKGITIAHWFIDEAQSGSSLDRNAFQAMILAANLHGAQYEPAIAEGILVLDLSRFGRDEVAAPVYIGLFRLHGYQVVQIQDHANLPTGGLEAIFESLSHYKNAQFLKDLTANTKRGLANVVQQTVVIDGRPVTGFSGGGFPPVGYKAIRVETGKRRNGDTRFNTFWGIDDNPDEWGETPWTRVCRAWQMMATGNCTYREIDDSCHLFADLSGYNDFFRRRTYLGIMSCGDIEVVDAHPKAVDTETFEQIQQLLAGRLRPSRHPEVQQSQYLLSGLLVCGYCGESIIGQSDPRRPDTRFYMCMKKKRKGENCALKRCPAWLLETAILDAVRAKVLTAGFQSQLLDEVHAIQWSEGDELAKEIANAERQLANVRQRVANLLDMIEMKGQASALSTRLSEREREQRILEARINALRFKLVQDRPEPLSQEALGRILANLREVLSHRDNVVKSRGVLEKVLLPRSSKLFDEAIELHYTALTNHSSPSTGSALVPAAGFEPAIFTLKG